MVDSIRIKNIDTNNEAELKDFLERAGDSLLKFRYFTSRPLSILKNHCLTILAFDAEQPVGYGHLDLENEVIWLGIAVAEKGRGKGTGKKIMDYLVTYADDNQIAEICLTVDQDNVTAVHLYKKFDFNIVKHLAGERLLMKRSNAN
jgi:ribosomal protein S18 acetylase RimI-like enzyme